MKITVLGAGSAFVLAKEEYHSSFLIESGDDNLLFDAGNSIAESLNARGVAPADIKNIFLSHNHSDHNGGLEYIGFKRYFSTFPFGESKPTLYGYRPILSELWENCLKGGMKYLEVKGGVSLSTYFNTKYLSINRSFTIGNATCHMIHMEHCKSLAQGMPSTGLIINEEGTKVMISGDTKLFAELKPMHEAVDIIFQDCEVAEYENSVHAQYHELVKLPEAIKAKMWLYHYTTKEGTIELPDAKADGFKGFVKRGDTFG